MVVKQDSKCDDPRYKIPWDMDKKQRVQFDLCDFENGSRLTIIECALVLLVEKWDAIIYDHALIWLMSLAFEGCVKLWKVIFFQQIFEVWVIDTSILLKYHEDWDMYRGG